MKLFVLCILVAYVALAYGDAPAAVNVSVDCSTKAKSYQAIVRWQESTEAIAVGTVKYTIEYQTSSRPGVWQEHRTNSVGRANIKLAPGATYTFRITAPGFAASDEVGNCRF